MNTPKKSNKTLISGIIIVCAVAVSIYMFSKNSAPSGSDSLLQSQATPQANAASARILNLRRQIESLKIDTTIFKNPLFVNLKDYTVEIPEVGVGRANPFAPIPGFVEAPVTTK